MCVHYTYKHTLIGIYIYVYTNRYTHKPKPVQIAEPKRISTFIGLRSIPSEFFFPKAPSSLRSF